METTELVLDGNSYVLGPPSPPESVMPITVGSDHEAFSTLLNMFFTGLGEAENLTVATGETLSTPLKFSGSTSPNRLAHRGVNLSQSRSYSTTPSRRETGGVTIAFGDLKVHFTNTSDMIRSFKRLLLISRNLDSSKDDGLSSVSSRELRVPQTRL